MSPKRKASPRRSSPKRASSPHGSPRRKSAQSYRAFLRAYAKHHAPLSATWMSDAAREWNGFKAGALSGGGWSLTGWVWPWQWSEASVYEAAQKDLHKISGDYRYTQDPADMAKKNQLANDCYDIAALPFEKKKKCYEGIQEILTKHKDLDKVDPEAKQRNAENMKRLDEMQKKYNEDEAKYRPLIKAVGMIRNELPSNKVFADGLADELVESKDERTVQLANGGTALYFCESRGKFPSGVAAIACFAKLSGGPYESFQGLDGAMIWKN